MSKDLSSEDEPPIKRLPIRQAEILELPEIINKHYFMSWGSEDVKLSTTFLKGTESMDLSVIDYPPELMDVDMDWLESLMENIPQNTNGCASTNHDSLLTQDPFDLFNMEWTKPISVGIESISLTAFLFMNC